MEWALQEIANWVHGTVSGDPHLRIRGIASIEEAKEGEITFLANPKYASKALQTRASAILVRAKIEAASSALVIVDDPYFAFTQLLSRFHPPRRYPEGIDPRAAIGQAVILGTGVSIGPFVTVEDGAKIGDRVQLGAGVFVGEGSDVGEESLIYPNVTIREGVKIGKRVIVHSGTVIGSDGFGFAPHRGKYHKIPQVGGVIIEDDVELGANVTVDRATLGNTIVGAGTKVDNLVQIGHNVVIGDDSILVAQVGISGSAKIGRHVTLAGQVGVAGHLTIGDNVVVGGKSGVTKDIPAGENVSGFPPLPHKTWLKAQASFPHLPELRERIKALEREVQTLRQQMAQRDERNG
ncbi:MAG: UDP-3-O-(3-hydroxymyristoyl)glucosamine N-acyltransferase [Candidatus Manganitrophaceae bacterium]|nr:MAG: UDP-3-O-(3-hydroxymyristoyl)glucosamine N-acyltransferase [Candidatus Manganitrophaceae bacterium]